LSATMGSPENGATIHCPGRGPMRSQGRRAIAVGQAVSRLFFPGPPLRQIIVVIAGATLAARDCRLSDARRCRMRCHSRALHGSARPAARFGDQPDRSGCDRARRRPFRHIGAIRAGSPLSGRDVFSDNVVTRLLPPIHGDSTENSTGLGGLSTHESNSHQLGDESVRLGRGLSAPGPTTLRRSKGS
jgi:hypothetical protein